MIIRYDFTRYESKMWLIYDKFQGALSITVDIFLLTGQYQKLEKNVEGSIHNSTDYSETKRIRGSVVRKPINPR